MGGAASRICLLLGCDSPTDSSRKRPGGVGGGGDGTRGDVRGGEARAGGGGGGSVSGTRVEVGCSVLLGVVSPPGVSARLCQRVSESSSPRWTDRLFSRSIGSPLRGLEALSVGPIPARFPLLPVEAPEMSFSISSEMNQVIRAGPTDGGGGRGCGRNPKRGMARAAAERVGGADPRAGPAGRHPPQAAAALWGRGAGAARALRSGRSCHGGWFALAAAGVCRQPRRALGQRTRGGGDEMSLLGGLGLSSAGRGRPAGRRTRESLCPLSGTHA